MKFGLNDYSECGRKEGFDFRFHFLQTHLFDIIHRTDTHIWLPKEKYVDKPKNFEMASFI